MNWRKLSSLLFFALICLFAQTIMAEKNVRLLVSAGTLTNHQRQAFYHSLLFQGPENPPFEILKVGSAFESDGMIFYAEGGLKREDLLQAVHEKSENRLGFLSSTFRGFSLAKPLPEEVIHYLGAHPDLAQCETRKIGERTIYGFFKKPKPVLKWPKVTDNLKEIPAALLSDKDGGLHVVVARTVGELKNRLGLIDHLRSENPNWDTAFFDLGTRDGDTSLVDSSTRDAITKRKPSAFFLGTQEMASLVASPNYFENLPVVYPFAERYQKLISLNGLEVNLWAGAFHERFWPLYQKLGKPKNLGPEFDQIGKNVLDRKNALNIVRVFSEDAAAKAATSVNVDMVLLISKDPYAQLPNTHEIIELGERTTGVYGRAAIIVRVSYVDLIEIRMTTGSFNRATRIEIKRHAITDEKPVAKDVVSPSMSTQDASFDELHGMPERSLTRSDFESVLGGIMLSHTKADVALFEHLSITTPIKGAISLDMAKNILTLPGNVITITVLGKLLKEVMKTLGDNVLPINYVVYGADSKTKTIGGRPIADNERFTVALSQRALLELFSIDLVGGMIEEFPVRAVFIEKIYGDMKSFYFIDGIKNIKSTVTKKNIENAVHEVVLAESFMHMIEADLPLLTSDTIQKFIEFPSGMSHTVLTFDLSYLDLGLSKNVTNDLYDSYASDRTLPMGRGKVERWAHIFIYAKGVGNLYTRVLQTSLSGEIKYMHTNLNKAPEKDKVKTMLKLRLPWEQSFFQGSDVVLAPIWKTIYETKLTPHFLSDHKDIPRPRTQKLDSLLGFNFDFTKLGFNVDLGALMSVDFTRTSAKDAVDFGPGLNFFSKWALFGPVELSSEITSYYLFPLPDNTALKKVAFAVEGTVWLRFMRLGDFSVAALSDFLVATLQETPKDFALSSIFGITISYGRLFRLFG